MDRRSPLPYNTTLPFPGMTCHIEEVIGKGSNAIVYSGWYPDALEPNLRHRVLVKELFPLHPQGEIYRDDGRLRVMPEAKTLWDTHRESFLQGNRVHLRLLAEHPEILGANLNSFSLNNTLYSVLGYAGGRSLQQELAGEKPTLRRVARWMELLLDALDAFHKSGCLHLDISPDNIMLVGEGSAERMFLIDYNSARALTGEGEPFLSFKAGYSPPEVSTCNLTRIGYGSDLYAVTAVFFRCLMGRPLSLEEMLLPRAPAGGGSPLLENAPQTVTAMVSRILKKGLHTLPSRRFRDTAQMREAFGELLDRIDCVGVTHWALWENGKRMVQERIRINPALEHLRGEDLYPIALEGRESASPERFVDWMLSSGGSSALLLGQGGMGKSTLLLHTALERSSRYSPAAPAVFYIPLGDWKQGDSRFVRRRILMSLRFKPENNTYDSAMLALEQLLSRPLKNGAPGVLLLLDGWNEAAGDKALLLEELRQLAAMPGVRMLISSRSELPELNIPSVRLSLLPVEDVADILGQKGLLLPRKNHVLELLRTPLTLSLFIRAAESGGQPDVESEGQLLEIYLQALRKKETAALPESDPVRWQLEAALELVLPAIAAEAAGAKGLPDDRQLLKCVARCRKLLRSRHLKQLFPQWIGHSRDILGDAETAEEWYGHMVHTILWQRLGLLLREPDGRWRVCHQKIGDYLAEKHKALLRRTRQRQLVHLTALAAAFALLISAGIFLYRKANVYEDDFVISTIERSTDGYVTCAGFHQLLQKQAEFAAAGDAEGFAEHWAQLEAALNAGQENAPRREYYVQEITAAILEKPTGDVSWSGKPFVGNLAVELMGCPDRLLSQYAPLAEQLRQWMESETRQQADPEFPSRLLAVLEAERKYLAELYRQVCLVHMEGGDRVWQMSVMALLEYLPEDYLITGEDGNLTALQQTLTEKKQALDGGESLEALHKALLGYLEPQERMLDAMLWALESVEDYFAEPGWEKLVQARMAFAASREALKAMNLPEQLLTQQQYTALMDMGVEADVLLVEYQALPATLREYATTLTYMERNLHLDIFVAREAAALREIAAATGDYMEQSCVYLGLQTNYLLLQTGDVALWEQLPEYFPRITACWELWREKPEDITRRTNQLLDEMARYGEAYDSYNRQMEEGLEILKQVVAEGDLSRLQEEIAEIPGMPEGIMTPPWMPMEAQRYYFVEDRQIQVGMPLQIMPTRCEIPCGAVPSEDVTGYLSDLGAALTGIDWETGENSMTIWAETTGGSMTIHWTPEETTLTLTEPVGNLIPALYLLALSGAE